MSDCLYHYLVRSTHISLTLQVFNLDGNDITPESVCTQIIPNSSITAGIQLDSLKHAAAY